jgi:hypothetical protein
MWVLTPCTWRKKLLNIVAARDRSEIGLPLLRKDAEMDFPTLFRFSLKTLIPV